MNSSSHTLSTYKTIPLPFCFVNNRFISLDTYQNKNYEMFYSNISDELVIFFKTGDNSICNFKRNTIS